MLSEESGEFFSLFQPVNNFLIFWIEYQLEKGLTGQRCMYKFMKEVLWEKNAQKILANTFLK